MKTMSAYTSHCPVSADEILEQILHDPKASAWIKQAIVSLGNFDITNAVNEVEVLAKILRHKVANLETVKVLRAAVQS